MLIPRIVSCVCAAGVSLLGVQAVCAQKYPAKPIRMITAEAGGGNDFGARLIAQGLTGSLGAQVIVDNRSSGMIPGTLLAKAPADGYTLLYYGKAFWIGPLFQDDAPYNPLKDFSPITLVGKAPTILVVHPSVAATTVKELITLAKAKPGTLNYASDSTGSPNHLAGELFKAMAGVNIVRIPYKGSGAAMNNLIGGEVQMSFGTAASVTPHVKSGRLRALGITSLQPSAVYPGLPTVASTLPGYEAGSIYAVFAPPKMPATLVTRLNSEIVRLLNTTEAKEKFFNTGVEVVASSPAELESTVNSDINTTVKMIKDARIRGQ